MTALISNFSFQARVGFVVRATRLRATGPPRRAHRCACVPHTKTTAQLRSWPEEKEGLVTSHDGAAYLLPVRISRARRSTQTCGRHHPLWEGSSKDPGNETELRKPGPAESSRHHLVERHVSTDDDMGGVLEGAAHQHPMRTKRMLLTLVFATSPVR